MDYAERCSASLVIKGMHIKTINYYITSIHLAKILKFDNTSAGEDVEQLDC